MTRIRWQWLGPTRIQSRRIWRWRAQHSLAAAPCRRQARLPWLPLLTGPATGGHTQLTTPTPYTPRVARPMASSESVPSEPSQLALEPMTVAAMLHHLHELNEMGLDRSTDHLCMPFLVFLRTAVISHWSLSDSWQHTLGKLLSQVPLSASLSCLGCTFAKPNVLPEALFVRDFHWTLQGLSMMGKQQHLRSR